MIAGLDLFTEYDLWTFLPQLVQVALILVAWFVAQKLLTRTFSRMEEKGELDTRVSSQFTLIFKYVMYLLMFFFILGILGISPNVVVTSLGVVGLAAGFAAQDVLSNLLGGVFLLFEDTINVGDVVRIGDVQGSVRLVKLRTTLIHTPDDNLVSIPNSTVIRSNVVNMTGGSQYMMIEVEVKVAYEADYGEVMAYMREVAESSRGVKVDDDHGIRFEVANIGERYRGMWIRMYFYVESSAWLWTKSIVQEKVVEKLVEMKVPEHKDAIRND